MGRVDFLDSAVCEIDILSSKASKVNPGDVVMIDDYVACVALNRCEPNQLLLRNISSGESIILGLNSQVRIIKNIRLMS